MTPHPSTTSTTLPAGIMANDKSATGRTTEQRLTLAERLDALHEHLGREGRIVVHDMMRELNGYMIDGERVPGLRQLNPGKYDDLPADGISCQELLVRLEADGRAVRNEPGGTLWRWAPGRAKEAVTRQPGLF